MNSRASTQDRFKKGPLALSEKEAEATAVYIGPRKLLGNFYSMIYVPNPMTAWQLRNTVRRALHLHPEFFAAAAEGLEANGFTPGEYGAIHNRLGDFEEAYKNFYLDPNNPSKFLSQPQNLKFLRQHGKIYMAVIATKKQVNALKTIFLPALRQEMPEPKMIINLSDKVRAVADRRVGHRKGWQGIIEMIICSQASTFMGSWGSTFTGYIHRLRGYMPHVADKRMLYTDSHFSDSRPFPLWSENSNPGQIAWMREWPEGTQL